MTALQRFLKLDSALKKTKAFWQLLAFNHDRLPWDKELCDFLWSLDQSQINWLESDQSRLYQAFGRLIPGVSELADLTSLPRLMSPKHAYPSRLLSGIKGRKSLQIQDFIAQLDIQDESVLEWCSGKGHLGRLMAYQGASHVHCVELQENLCQQGEKVAQQQQLNVRFSCLDVLTDSVADVFSVNQHAVALHACGGLHQVLMSEAVKAKTAQISFSPCCYHLHTEEPYVPMSDAAKLSANRFAKNDLKLALQETVTAPNHVRRLRTKEVVWRLAFDELRRKLLSEEGYLPVPSVHKSIFSGSFEQFCRWAADQKGCVLPSRIDDEKWLRLGEQRYEVTSRVDLVRHVFRRALEVWLDLDRMLYLEESGYHVDWGEFCCKTLTPRNILIRAKRA